MNLTAANEVRLEFPPILHNGNEVVDNNIFPDVFLEYFDKVDTIVAYLQELEHLKENGLAVFDAVECIS